MVLQNICQGKNKYFWYFLHPLCTCLPILFWFETASAYYEYPFLIGWLRIIQRQHGLALVFTFCVEQLELSKTICHFPHAPLLSWCCIFAKTESFTGRGNTLKEKLLVFSLIFLLLSLHSPLLHHFVRAPNISLTPGHI